MIKFGSVRDPDSIRKETIGIHQKLDEPIFRVTIQIGNIAHDIVVDKILSFDKENIADWTDADISYHLEKCAIWRFTFLSAAEELYKIIQNKKRDYKEWYANRYNEGIQYALDWRRNRREAGDASGWLGSPTKQEVDGFIRTHITYGLDMREKLSEIERLEANKNKLIELRGAMEERAFDLKTIGEWRIKQKVFPNPNVQNN